MSHFFPQSDLGLYGDGSDGDVVISSSVTLSRTMMYNSLYITSTGILHPNGYPFFVKTVFTTEAGALVICNGGDADFQNKGAGSDGDTIFRAGAVGVDGAVESCEA